MFLPNSVSSGDGDGSTGPPTKGKGKKAPPTGQAPPALPQGSVKHTNGAVSTTLVNDFKLDISASGRQNIIDGLLKHKRVRNDCMVIANNELVISSDNSLYNEAGNMISFQEATAYPQIINTAPLIVQTTITFLPPVSDGALEESLAQSYCQNGAVQSRSLVSSLRGGFKMSRAFAEAIVPQFMSGLQKFDVTTMFVMGHIMINNLATCERNGWVPVMQPVPPGNISLVNTDVPQQQAGV